MKYILIALIGVVFMGCAVQNPAVETLSDESITSPPTPPSRSDFPSHEIDVEKYFTPVERQWDERIEIKQKFIDDIVSASDKQTPYTAYVQAYNMAQVGQINKDVFSRFEEGEVIPYREEYDQCIDDAEKELEDTRNTICRGEKIINNSRVEQFENLESQEKLGNLTEGGKVNLQELRSDEGAIYDNCTLPGHLRYLLDTRQYAKWDQCGINFEQKLEEEGHL